jgi:hypothetical protein
MACARLARLRALPRDRYDCFVIDSDDQSPLARRLKTFDETWVAGSEKGEHPLAGAEEIHPPFARQAGKTEFGQIVIRPESSTAEREVFELLFDDDASRKDLQKGMFGRPSIAATVYALGPDIAGLAGALNSAEQVVVCGSFAGGTGAGITHQLVSILRKQVGHKKLYGVFLLPWLRLGGSGEADVNDAVLDKNKRHGLDYYFNHTAPQLSRSVLLGVPDQTPDWLKPAVPDLNKSEETPHLLHLIAAETLKELPELPTVAIEGQVYVYGYDEAQRAMPYRSMWDRVSLLDRVQAGQFVLHLLTHLGSAKMKEEMFGAFRPLIGSPKAITKPLYETLNVHMAKPNTLDKKTFIGRVIEGWATSRRQLESSLGWVSSLIGSPGQHNLVDEAKSNPMAVLERHLVTHTADPVRIRTPEEVAFMVEDDLFNAFMKGTTR